MNETLNTFLVGTLVFAGFTFYDLSQKLKTNRASASGLEKQIFNQAPVVKNEVFSIIIENEPFKLDMGAFLFAKAECNYTTFYFSKNDQLVKQLKRATLKSVIEQVAPLAPTVIRSHRAYFVNTRHIKKMTGDAQGYHLYFDHVDFAIPVSRAMIPSFKKQVSVN